MHIRTTIVAAVASLGFAGTGLGQVSFAFTNTSSTPGDNNSTWVALGDLDGDGLVGGADLLILLSDWGPCPTSSQCAGDIDENGLVDGNDLLLLLAEWNG